MPELIESGRIIDLILLAMILEACILAALRKFADLGPGLKPLLPILAAGACLMLALRAALTGADWPSIAAWLALALVAHGGDLAVRWRQR